MARSVRVVIDPQDPCDDWELAVAGCEQERTSTPLLVIAPNEIYHDSTDILVYLSEKYPDKCGFLFPPDKADEVSITSGPAGPDCSSGSRGGLVPACGGSR
jgi:hypothetical protein